MKKREIESPEPGTLPPRISFIEQMGGSAGYYVRFQNVPEEKGGPVEKYVSVLRFDRQEEALQAAIAYRDRKAKELGLPKEPEPSPHSDEVREKMSDAHNRTGLRGLGLTFNRKSGTVYPTLTALWSEEGGQRQVSRGMTSRGIYKTMEELTPYLKEHLHPDVSEEELIHKGAEGTARLLLTIADRAEPESQKRKRILSLIERWSAKSERDQDVIERARDTNLESSL